MTTRVGIGKASHRFLPDESSKLCKIGGLQWSGVPGFSADSDGDVVLYAICHAIACLTGISILEELATDLCRKAGITDSGVYVQKALETLKQQKIVHIGFCIEAKRPRLQERIEEMRKSIANLLHITIEKVGITTSSGDGLSNVGCGDGVECLCIMTTSQ